MLLRARSLAVRDVCNELVFAYTSKEPEYAI
jgi:hypothetical protein